MLSARSLRETPVACYVHDVHCIDSLQATHIAAERELTCAVLCVFFYVYTCTVHTYSAGIPVVALQKTILCLGYSIHNVNERKDIDVSNSFVCSFNVFACAMNG